MKLKKILLTLLSAILLVAISVGATVAYLTADTGAVTNTFTVGNVTFDDPDETLAGGLDEVKVDEYGVVDTEATQRVTENTYKLVPNHEYIKDPTVHVGTDSEEAWLFVKVVNPIVDIEAGVTDVAPQYDSAINYAVVNGTIAEQMDALGWTAVAGAEGVYAYDATVSAGDDVVVFAGFALQNGLDNATLENYRGLEITIDAYLVQADGFDTAAEAWAAAPTTWGE